VAGALDQVDECQLGVRALPHGAGEAPASGNLIVGVTRLGAVPGASGSGTLVTLRFRSIASGTGSLSFTRSEAVDADGRPIGGVSFVGGSVQSTL
jgi:hypothetical protein